LRATRRAARAGGDDADPGRAIRVLLCRCTIVAASLAAAAGARAQVSGVIGVDSQNRYRGLATDDVGAVLHASVMADTPAYLYAGLSGIWRLHDGALANADAILGFSGRFSDIETLRSIDAAWGWDIGVHRRHYGENTDYDFSELMAGLLGPGFSARVWWSPSYFGQPYTSLYGEVNAAHEFGEHWRVFAHVGVLRYGTFSPPWPGGTNRVPGRTDGLAGGAYVTGPWELRVARDGLLAGEPFPGTPPSQRGPGWIVSASYAF
jgi:hypothetical protein